MRLIIALLMVPLPSWLKRLIGRRMLGWDVHPTAYIGRSVILVRRLSMGPGANIGPLNMIRHLEELRMGEGASIGTRNWITGWPLAPGFFEHSPNRMPALIMAKGAIITVAHNIDCCDRVELGEHSAIAGFGTSVLTHNLDLVRDRFIAFPVVIGDHSAVMSDCTLNSGVRVPAHSIVSARSVVATKLVDEFKLYRGNPAVAVRELPPHLGFFTRTQPVSSTIAAATEPVV